MIVKTQVSVVAVLTQEYNWSDDVSIGNAKSIASEDAVSRVCRVLGSVSGIQVTSAVVDLVFVGGDK